MNINFTSHFLGISLQSSQFCNLFLELQEYIFSRNLENALELVNPISLHITLCYLGFNVSKDQHKIIVREIQGFQDIPMQHISMGSCGYFGEPGNEKVFYIAVIDQDTILSSMNQRLVKILEVENIIDNTFSFVPHLTLARIHDATVFSMHKTHIEGIIQNFLDTHSDTFHISSLDLYGVNSRYKPELQYKLELI